MSKRKPKLYLEDIRNSIEKIEEYTEDSNFDEFIKDRKTIDAVVRNNDNWRGGKKYSPTNKIKKP